MSLASTWLSPARSGARVGANLLIGGCPMEQIMVKQFIVAAAMLSTIVFTKVCAQSFSEAAAI
jgi:hypothetical protein